MQKFVRQHLWMVWSQGEYENKLQKPPNTMKLGTSFSKRRCFVILENCGFFLFFWFLFGVLLEKICSYRITRSSVINSKKLSVEDFFMWFICVVAEEMEKKGAFNDELQSKILDQIVIKHWNLKTFTEMYRNSSYNLKK